MRVSSAQKDAQSAVPKNLRSWMYWLTVSYCTLRLKHTWGSQLPGLLSWSD